jgi:Predicted membrane protein
VLAAFFVGAGVLHFVKPGPYESIMPPQLPYPRELIYGSGVAEILGGLGVLSSRLRPWAGLWLIGLLIAVFPANVYHAFAADEIPGNPAPQAALHRPVCPLQARAHRVGVDDHGSGSPFPAPQPRAARQGRAPPASLARRGRARR